MSLEIRDKFNVKCIHQTKSDGIELFIPTSKPQGISEMAFNAGKYDSSDYFQWLNRTRHVMGNVRPSNDMHFKKGILNVEATGYFKFVNGIDDVAIKLRGGHHSTSPEVDSARCYIFRIQGDGENNFAKEYPHKNGQGYSHHKIATKFKIGERKDLQGKWLGIKGIIWNEGADKVHCQCWIDLHGINENDEFEPNNQVWDLWYELVDTDGKFGEDNNKHKTASVWTTLQKNSTVQFRVDGEKNSMKYFAGNFTDEDGEDHNATFKFLSAREINVDADH